MRTSNQGFILEPLRTIENQYHGTNIPEIDSLFLSQFENNCHKQSVWFNRFIHLTEKITQDIFLVIIFYSLMTFISLFLWYDIFISLLSVLILSHDCCLLENCVRVLFEIIWGCTIIVNRTTLYVFLTTFYEVLSILRHSLYGSIRKTLEWQTPTICLIKLFFYPIGLDQLNGVCSFHQCRYPETQPWLR